MKKTLCTFYLLCAVICSFSQESYIQMLISTGNKYLQDSKYEKAAEYYKKAADKGDSYAQYALGIMYFKGAIGEGQNNEQALYWIRKAAEQGFSDAQTDIGIMYYKGYGTSIDNVQAAYWFDKAAKQGNALSQKMLGYMYMYGLGVNIDYSQSLYWSQKAADQGEEEAINNLGQLFENGWGTPIDYHKAFDLYKQATDKNCVAALNNLGHLYYKGLGVSKDYNEAASWYQKAAEKGFAASQSTLGYMYMYALGRPQDYKKAYYWTRRAADQDFPEAQNNLGFLYMNGWGIIQDNNQALSWYQKAANNNHAVAQNNMGYMYENGLGVSKDINEALSWYKKAYDNGYKEVAIKIAFLNDLVNTSSDFGHTTVISSSAAEKCYALVIGNDNYSWETLSNPVNDAKDFAEKLKTFGFNVTCIINTRNKTEMTNSIISFCEKARECDVALLYFSGHGCQFKGKDYILPLINTKDFDSIPNVSVSLEWILDKMKEYYIKDRIIMLDACRSNNTQNAGTKGSEMQRGFSAKYDLVAAERGICIAYSTQANEEAYDGTDFNLSHSPYMEALLSLLDENKVNISNLLNNAIFKVEELTNYLQKPVNFSNLHTNFYFTKNR